MGSSWYDWLSVRTRRSSSSSTKVRVKKFLIMRSLASSDTYAICAAHGIEDGASFIREGHTHAHTHTDTTPGTQRRRTNCTSCVDAVGPIAKQPSEPRSNRSCSPRSYDPYKSPSTCFNSFSRPLLSMYSSAGKNGVTPSAMIKLNLQDTMLAGARGARRRLYSLVARHHITIENHVQQSSLVRRQQVIHDLAAVLVDVH